MLFVLSPGSGEESETEYKKDHSLQGDNSEDENISKEEALTTDSLVDEEAAFGVHIKSLLPHELELRNAGTEGVWTTVAIPRGTKYGPYTGKWLPKPIDTRFAWEVNISICLRIHNLHNCHYSQAKLQRCRKTSTML